MGKITHMAAQFIFIGVSKIVMEYAKFGDLHCHLRKLRSTGLDDAKQFAFAQQIAEGMNFVASKGVRKITRGVNEITRERTT